MTDQPVPASDVEPEAQEKPGITDEERVAFLATLETGRYHRIPVEMVKLAKINPRRGDVASAIQSLREFGQHRAAVVQQSNAEVVIGNHMLKGIYALGWAELDIFLVDDTDDKALRRGLADNATGDRATWEEAELAQVLERVGAVPGFEEADVDRLLKKLEPDGPKAEPTYPITPRLNEKYDFVVIFAENETDFTWLQTRFDLQREKSYKNSAVALSHVLTVSRLQELLGEDS